MFSRISKSLPVSFVVAFLLSASPLLAQAPAIEVHFNWRTEKEQCRDYRAAVSEARDPYLPDTNRTPGKLRPGWTLEMTEAKGGTQQYRDVPVKLKREVWHNYGYDTTVGSYDAHHKDYEFDHLIPNCLGGASVKENIWPQPLTGPWNAHDKDRLEHHVGCRSFTTRSRSNKPRACLPRTGSRPIRASLAQSPTPRRLTRRMTPPHAPRRIADDGTPRRDPERRPADFSRRAEPARKDCGRWNVPGLS